MHERNLEERVDVSDADDVTVASRAALTAASSLGAGPRHASRLDLVIRELAWNLVRHAGGGTIRLLGLRERDRRGLQLECRDQGAGVSSPVGRRTRDGLGFGLAAVQRHSNEFTMHSSPWTGTFIRSVIWWPSTSS